MLRLLSPFHSVLLALPPERAHDATLKALRYLPVQKNAPDDARLHVHLLGLNFSNPVGMAAGFDKNALVADKLLALGFGFVEVGGVTPRAQSGNPRPRVFRLNEDGALINRLGFNNEGLQVVRARLEGMRKLSGVIGINLGANKDSMDRVQDYLTLLAGLDGLADFVTLNISSPNTPGLRGLQDKEHFSALLQRVSDKRANIKSRNGGVLPVLVKIAPDVALDELDDICALAVQHRIDGMIVSNTTLLRLSSLRAHDAKETGGLSGKPLFDLSTRRLAQTRQRVGEKMVLIGVGGIDSGEAAWAKICAGANLVQLYTALVYKGLPLLDEIKATLCRQLEAHGFSGIEQAVGSQTGKFAQE
ncbi:MAG: quinone-dependent dihydroorotate dehydrogenase [Pseudomonadota bacterium]